MNIVGQRKNTETFFRWKRENRIPQFVVFIGDKGSGKKTLARFLYAESLDLPIVDIGIKVDDIREMIDMATTTKGVYLIADADAMSVGAKNALLKIVEEPPEDRYFVLTVCDEDSLLETIKSRAQIIRMDNYTIADLRKYNENAPKEYYSIASNPGMLDRLCEYGPDFLSYCELVIDNIQTVESANAFKSGNKLALKSDEGYDLDTFFSAIEVLAIGVNPLITMSCCAPHKALSKLGINKQQLYDKWVFEVRSLV